MALRIFELSLRIVLSFLIGFLCFLSYICGLLKHGPTKWMSVKKRNDRPDLLNSDKFGTHHWIPLKRTRLKLHYVAKGLEGRPLMLFVHGFPEFWYSWRYQLNEFSSDYRAVAFDLRGYGDSDKPKGVAEYTIDKIGDDIDQLIEGLGYKKCILVGHDWGGAAAWYFASKFPSKVEKLIVCNCPHPTAFQMHIRSSFVQVTKSWYMFLFMVPCLPILMLRVLDLNRISAAFCGKSMGAKPGTFTPDDIEAYKYIFAEYDDLCGPINYYRAALRDSDDLWPKSKVQSPTLMIWGTKDGALEKCLADLSGNYVDNYSVRYIEGASHWVQQEEPELTNSLIRQFLKDNA